MNDASNTTTRHGKSAVSLAMNLFTLIELLVVVAIIAILVSMISPAYRQAIAVAQTVVCSNNLKNVAVAFSTYVSDFEVFPPHRLLWEDYDDPSYWEQLPYWATLIQGKDTSKKPVKVDSYIADDQRIFQCPSLESAITEPDGLTWEWKFNTHSLGYGYNAYFLGPWCWVVPPGLPTRPISPGLADLSLAWAVPDQFVRMNSIQSPSQNILVAETRPWNSFTLWWPDSGLDRYLQEGQFQGVVDTRHPGGAAIVFNDGHVELRNRFDVNPPTNPFGTGNDTHSELWDPKQRKNPNFHP